VAALLATACGAGRIYGRGQAAARAGDWDSAVEYYRQAVQADPDDPTYQLALSRAMLAASEQHLDQAQLAEVRGQLDMALREYRRASELDPANRAIATKVSQVERTIRDQIEAARRPPPSAQPATPAFAPPALADLNTVVQPIRFVQASVRDILDSIGELMGINVTYDTAFQDRVWGLDVSGLTLGDVLDLIMLNNGLFYQVLNPTTIIVIPDTAPKRAQFEQQVVRRFAISYVDINELMQTLTNILRPTGTQQIAPSIAANESTRSLTVRATTPMMDIIEQVIRQHDKPQAEVIVDVQILEVNRNRAKQFGLDLGSYSINAAFSPESDPRPDAAASDASALISRPFNLNTVSRGVSASDFYLSVPTALIRFLESDTETKVIAKPQLRGSAGADLTLNLGEDIPVPSTTFTPIAGGGANINPLTSFDYRNVGVNLELTPQVTIDGDVLLDLRVETSTLGGGIDIAGQNLPSFGSRAVETRLRLRDGESSLLAGLLQESERTSLTGLPWLLNVPVIKQLFSSNDRSVQQTDIIMLLTPRIVRTAETTAEDLAPIFIGPQGNPGLTGPPATLGVAQAGAADAGTQPAGDIPPLPPADDTAANTGAPGAGAAGAATPGAPTPSAGQVLVSVPELEFRRGGGPYLVPVSITGASQISGVTLTVTYNPAVLRLVSVQEGSFMRSGGAGATFDQKIDSATGRVDIVLLRPGDLIGVAGSGLLAGLQFESVGPGPANLSVTGSATGPGGMPVALQFAPVAAVRVP
jgi:general secretion pathway protein D